ncbi:hypothetical protein HP456_21335 [Bacillus haikouensis]|uniref:hypothetical protein n=1 Tax=Bacillus haikouensis TaxID=1510468 RepID=UPI00155537F9|nr:hypothetical protein [Bacillus haikouensis]NQD68454.1 hypothetical protein [Bacillus haikouensis]
MKQIKEFIYSTDIVNTATILSVILAIVFFLYQEYKKRKEHQKEILQLRDQVINLVIRNHVNSGVKLTNIDLESFIDGFEKTKNCSLRLRSDDISRMVYAKVYENEHIASELRLELLNQLEELISSNKYEVTVEQQSEKDQTSISTSRISIVVILFLFILLLQMIIKYFDFDYFKVIIMTSVVIIILSILKPEIDIIIGKLVNGLLKSEKNEKIQNRGDTNFVVNKKRTVNFSSSALKKTVSQNIKFEDYFLEADEIRRTFEKRILIESIIRRLYLLVYNEDTKMPVYRVINKLVDEGVLPKELAQEVNIIYRLSSYVIHEGQKPPEINEFNELINPMQDIADILNDLLENYKRKNL